jgi:hypothetical protein
MKHGRIGMNGVNAFTGGHTLEVQRLVPHSGTFRVKVGRFNEPSVVRKERVTV